MTDLAEDHASDRSSLSNEIFVVGASVLLFVLAVTLIDRAREVGGWADIAAVGVAGVICLVLRGPRADEISQPTNIIIRVIAIMLGIYVLLSPLSFPSGVSSYTDNLMTASRAVAIVSVAFGFAAIRYPIFVIVPCVGVLATKAIGEDLFDIGISPTDYIPVVEIGLYLGIGLCLLTPQRKCLPFPPGKMIASADAEKTSTLLFMVGVGVHFANYFYSGMAKILLDGGPLLWVMQNPTEALTLNAWVGGFLPSTFLFSGEGNRG
ncbi:hypothetical protein FMN50_23695 [Rhodobacterales bacterium]|nr:hypothetical protein FMN50_23695 [Rhodobacterales bacterium]